MPTSTEKVSQQTTTRRKKLTTLIWDTDFYMRTATRMLAKREGPTAVLVYQVSICWAAYEQSGAIIRESALSELLFHLQDLGIELSSVDALSNLLDGICAVGYLRWDDSQCAWVSDRLLTELGIVGTKQENYRSGALKREAAKRDKKQDSAESIKTEQNPAPSTKTEQARKEQEEEQEEEQEQDPGEVQEGEPECVPIGTPVEPDPPDELAEFANDHLEPLEVATTRDFNAAMQGRRPMKKYPMLWFRPDELAKSVELYGEQGIPPEQCHLGFRFVAEWMQGQIDAGRSAKQLSNRTSFHVNGMGLIEAKKQYAAFLDVKRKKSYVGEK